LKVPVKRWYFSAVLLFLLVGIAACGETPEETDSPTVQAVPSTAGTQPPVTISPVPSETPVPKIEFKGITFEFDETILGAVGEMQQLPPSPPGTIAAQPERLQIRLQGGEEAPILLVFPVEQYKAISSEAGNDIDALARILEERPAEVTGDLPLLPMYRAIESYRSQPTYLSFGNGSGIRFMVRADHDHNLETEEAFFYTFQGLTEDGRFYVAAFVPLTGELEDGDGGHAAAETPADHSAKLAENGAWIGVETAEGHSVVDDILLSLVVAPDSSFPSMHLPNYITAEDFIVGYDEAISGAGSLSYVPSIVEDPQGELQYLLETPDSLIVTFEGLDPGETGALLKVQPLRDEDDAFFNSIADWQKDDVQNLAGNAPAYRRIVRDYSAADVQEVSFQNGSGVRWTSAGDVADGANSDSPDDLAPVYHFAGVSEDGRYLVTFRHALPQMPAQEDALAYLDSVVQSVLAGPNASTESSVPSNPEDCEDSAVFVEDVSLPDGTIVESGEFFVKIWRVRNDGSCTWTPSYGVDYAQGNPIEWQALAITDIVAPGETAEVGISAQSPANAGIYQAWWQMRNANGNRFGDQLGLRFEAPRPATEIPGYGVIEGEISYPASGNPAIDIYFVSVDGGERFSMQTEQGWTRYANALPVGSYYVFARVAGDSSESGGGYTKAVTCGLQANCKDHDLLEVVVEEGRASRDINIFDWYAPAGSFPFPAS
jgi:Ig-like domain from next to BRCA1 gene